MPYKSHVSGPDRVFDHLYDPLYTTSGAKNIWKENHNALYRSAPIHIYPQYNNMFTDLPRCPRNYYIQQRNPLPHFPFISDFIGGAANTDESKNVKMFREASVGGKDRAKFFNIPLNNEITMNLKLDIKEDNGSYKKCSSKTPNKAFRTIGCETIYREQSAQTKPWMPDAFIEDKANETPEVIYAANIIESDDTPGLLEAKRFERSRRRRKWEKSLIQSVITGRPHKIQIFLANRGDLFDITMRKSRCVAFVRFSVTEYMSPMSPKPSHHFIMKKKADRQWVANCLVNIRDETSSYASTANLSFDTYSKELESHHAILLQKIIKGRAIQSILHEGKEANQELINQLKKSFELESVWRAQSFDDWNEDSVMELLKQYLDKEFAQYSEQKKFRDLRLLAEEERRRRDDDEHQIIQNEITGYLENALTDCFETLSKSNTKEFWDISKKVKHSTDDSFHDMSSDVSNNLLLTEEHEQLSDENQKTVSKPNMTVTDPLEPVTEQLIPHQAKEIEDSHSIAMDVIEHLLQKVIPNPGEDVVNNIIDDVVEKVIFLDEVTTATNDDNTENSEEEICSLLDDIFTQTYHNLERRFKRNESSDDTE